MTKVYDFSVTNIQEHTYAFAEMTPLEITEKKTAFEEYQKAKAKPAAPPAVAQNENTQTDAAKPPQAKPVFRPKIKPPDSTPPPPPADV